MKLAIFASGTGSNALTIINHFQHDASVQVSLLVSDNPKAGILQTITAFPNIKTVVLSKEEYISGAFLLALMHQNQIDYVILAGYLKLIPAPFIKAFPEKIINIHPSLLPKFGGKGMYGRKVHEAVIAAKEKESGITIHFVDEVFDHGQPIFQAKIPINPDWTAEDLQKEVLKLEHLHFPKIIEQVLREDRQKPVRENGL